MKKSMSFNNITIVYVKGNAYKTNFWYKRRVFQNMGVYSLVNCEKIE